MEWVLLPQDEASSAVRVVNVSSSPYMFAEDVCMGSTTTAMTLESSEELVRDGDCSTCSTQQPDSSKGLEWKPDRPRRQDDWPPRQVDQTLWTGGHPQRRGDETVGVFTNQNEQLEPVIASLPSDLSPAERVIAERLIFENSDVFSKSDFDLRRSSLVHHRIDTGNHRPFKKQLRRHPLVHLECIDEQVDKMLKADVIEPCASPWSSNMVVAKKSDGSLRFCIDYHRLNNLTYKDAYTIPREDSYLDALGGSKYFSTLDLRSFFWQVAMDPKDSDKTAFVTRKGHYRFKVLSFGLANSPSVFQRLMDLVLKG